MKPVFLLDVDGVLKKGGAPLKCGQDALDYLEANNITYLLVSNTTGEDQVVYEHLTKIMQRPIDSHNLIISSSPLVQMFKDIPKDTPMLMIGAPKFTTPFINRLGLTKVFSPADLQLQEPRRCPQYLFCETLQKQSDTTNIYNKEIIEYLIFYADSTDWYADIQIALDCIINNGQLALDVDNRVCSSQQLQYRKQIKVICTNPDVTYSDIHVLPRLTIGALAETVKALYQHQTDEQLHIEYLGKPYSPIFQLAFQKLEQQPQNQKIKYFMIGDSLSADSAGANANGAESIHVLTGKDQQIDCDNCCSEQKPQKIYNNVYEAIISIMKEFD